MAFHNGNCSTTITSSAIKKPTVRDSVTDRDGGIGGLVPRVTAG
jgi:hypothetical protein